MFKYSETQCAGRKQATLKGRVGSIRARAGDAPTARVGKVSLGVRL